MKSGLHVKTFAAQGLMNTEVNQQIVGLFDMSVPADKKTGHPLLGPASKPPNKGCGLPAAWGNAGWFPEAQEAKENG